MHAWVLSGVGKAGVVLQLQLIEEFRSSYLSLLSLLSGSSPRLCSSSSRKKPPLVSTVNLLTAPRAFALKTVGSLTQLLTSHIPVCPLSNTVRSTADLLREKGNYFQYHQTTEHQHLPTSGSVGSSPPPGYLCSSSTFILETTLFTTLARCLAPRPVIPFSCYPPAHVSHLPMFLYLVFS
ncbi:hypothetical protein AMECASPLE_035127, partial [Ameca splendens]